MTPKRCLGCNGNAFGPTPYCTKCTAARAATTIALTDKGIAQSVDHADRVAPGWGADALYHFQRHAKAHETFLTEEVRQRAYFNGLDVPPAPGAWGHVARMAKKAGFVAAIGKRPSSNPEQHGKEMTVWRSLIFTPPTQEGTQA